MAISTSSAQKPPKNPDILSSPTTTTNNNPSLIPACAMASLPILRLAARPAASTLCRPCTRTIRRAPLVAQSISAKSAFSSSAVQRSSGHEEETFEEFSARYDTHLSVEQGYKYGPCSSCAAGRAGHEFRALLTQHLADMRRSLIPCRMFLSCRYASGKLYKPNHTPKNPRI